MQSKVKQDGTERIDYAYDENGNLISKVVTKGEKIDRWEYAYDLLNQLEQVKKNGEVVSSYIYDPNGFRVEKVGSKGKIHYVPLLNGEVGYRKEFSTNAEYSFIYVGGQHFARVNGVVGGSGKKFYYHNDHLGSALAVTDEKGGKVVERDFTPFGERINTDVYDDEPRDLDEDESGFTGKDWDVDAELYYYNARWYDPEVGRFITEDSANDDLTRYVYCGNNPVNFVDPTGHFKLNIKLDIAGGLKNLAAMYIPGFAELQALDSFSKLIASRKNPLVFVHGFNSSWTCWTDFLSKMTSDAKIEGNKTIKDLAEEFDNKDTDPKRKAEILGKVQAKLKESQIYIFDYSDDNLASPKKLGVQFKDFMKENNLDKNTDVITHSMGGLIVREAVEFHGVELNKLAMIAPPNQGSDLAYHFHRTITGIEEVDSIQLASRFSEWSVGYMDPASKGLQRLNAEENVNILKERVKKVAIFAGERDDAVALNRVKIPFTDYSVTTYKAGIFGPNRVHKEFWPVGQHNALLSSIFVQRDVAQFLYGQ